MLQKRPKLLIALLIASNLGSLVHAQADKVEAVVDEAVVDVAKVTELSKTAVEARDCFSTSQIYGDQDDNHVTFNDLDKLDTLKKDHVIDAVRVCPDVGNRNVLGLQVSYRR